MRIRNILALQDEAQSFCSSQTDWLKIPQIKEGVGCIRSVRMYFFLETFGLTFVYKNCLIDGEMQPENVSVQVIWCQGMGISNLSEKEMCLTRHTLKKIQFLCPEPPAVTGFCQLGGLISMLWETLGNLTQCKWENDSPVMMQPVFLISVMVWERYT